MRHSDKIRRWVAFAESRGIKESLIPLDLLFLKIGLRLKPILFWNYFSAAIVFGCAFGLFIGAVLFFPIWTLNSPHLELALRLSGIAGVAFGIYAAWLNKRSREKLGLPKWEEILQADEKPML